MRSRWTQAVAVLAVTLAGLIQAKATRVFTVRPAGNQGFDVCTDGVLVAQVRLAAHGRSLSIINPISGTSRSYQLAVGP